MSVLFDNVRDYRVSEQVLLICCRNNQTEVQRTFENGTSC